MITVEQLRNQIIGLISSEINNQSSSLYIAIRQLIVPKIQSMISDDNSNDIHWDETDKLFGIFDGYGDVSTDTIGHVELNENGNYIVTIDESNLISGEEYTLKYIDTYNKELVSFDKITRFIAQ
jgi:hypothetical protein